MTQSRRSLLLLTVLTTLFGCKPKEQDTSLSYPVGPNPGPPKKRLSLVWLHHSTGDRLLKGGLLEALKANNIDFYDINYKEAAVDGYVIGDHTDIPDWPKNFNTRKYFDVIKSWELKGEGKQHQIVMFKSCYPNSNIKDDATLAKYKELYNSLLPTFTANPEILFIGMSTPPLVKPATTPQNAARARAFAKWIGTEYAKGIKNVRIFDIFNALAVNEAAPQPNTLPRFFAEGDDDSHPTPKAAAAFTRLFIPWFNRIVRQAGFSG